MVLHLQKVTQTQRREYNYDVVLKGLGYSVMAANLVFTWRTYVTKSMTFWPLALIPAVYYVVTPM